MRMVVTDQCLTNGATFQGSILREVIQDPNSLIFYDWLISDNMAVGIELHDTRNNVESFVGEGTGTFHYTSEFPRLLFWPDLDGFPIGCEAFGDLKFFEMDNSMRVMTVAHTAFRGGGVRRVTMSDSSRAFPRFLALWTNSNRAMYSGSFSCEMPRWGRSQERKSDQQPSIVLT